MIGVEVRVDPEIDPRDPVGVEGGEERLGGSRRARVDHHRDVAVGEWTHEADRDTDLEITSLWDRGLDGVPTTGVMGRYLARFADARQAPRLGDRWTRGGIALEVVGIGAGPAENARGLALRVEVSAVTAAVLGDLPAAEAVAAAARTGPVDVLWASHHGARGGFDPALVDLLEPGLVVISAGYDNRYCHPAPEVLAWLAERAVWITGAAGTAAHGRCPALAPSLGPAHVVRGEDLVLRADE